MSTQRLSRAHRASRSSRGAALACLMSVGALIGAGCGNDTDDRSASTTAPEASESTTTASSDSTEASGAEGFEFTSEGGEYSVTFPLKPTAQPTPMQLPGGRTLEMPLQVVTTTSSEYTSGTVTYPDEIPVSDDPDQMLDGSVDGAVDAVPGAEIDNVEEIEVDGVPGRRVDFSITQGDAEGSGEAIFMLDGQSMFHAIAFGETGDGDAHADFVESFEVL